MSYLKVCAVLKHIGLQWVTWNFNRSIWHALWILVPLAGVVFAVSLLRVKWGHWYFFDPKHNEAMRARRVARKALEAMKGEEAQKALKIVEDVEGMDEAGDYGSHMQRYQGLSKLLITLSAGAIAFLINIISGQKPPLPGFALKLSNCTPIVTGFFGFAIASLIGFMTVQDIWYEEYCHSPKHDTFKAWKYATSTSLGATGLLSFVLAFLWLAANIFPYPS